MNNLQFRNRRGEPASSFSATDAKKQFGRVLDMVRRGGAVVITKHDQPKAILLSVDDFNALAKATEKVDIKEKGSVEGDIVAPRVAIADGSHFKGSVDMQRKEGANGDRPLSTVSSLTDLVRV